MAEHKNLRPGMTLRQGEYKIERVLGQGTFGITYCAKAKFTTQGALGEMSVEATVAIKEFFMHEVNGRNSDGSSVEGSTGSVFTNYRRKFRREAENLAKLSHEGIVKVYDVFDANNTTYYAMEFIDGESLNDYISRMGRIPEPEALEIVRQVGDALQYMHSQKMLHLDIKPGNIMRRADGRPVLIDFGLAKQFTDSGEPESSTSIGHGTPGYAPIEQSARKSDSAFPTTLDVYALGATLFKMLTGRRPPEATSILNEGFPEQELRSIGISDTTVTALVKAMAPMKRNRLQTIPAFLSRLSGQPGDEVVEDGGNDDDEVTIVTTGSGGADNPGPVRPEVREKHRVPDKPYLDPPPPPEPPVIQGCGHGQQAGAEEDTPGGESKSRSWIWITVAMVAAFVAVLIWRGCSGSTGTEYIDNDTIAPELFEEVEVVDTFVTAPTVTAMAWESPLGKAVYTGEVTTDASGRYLPHGTGEARITGGQYKGAVYNGEFSYGNMEGPTTYTTSSGDVFTGEFHNNQYSRGRYTVKSSGDYFVGSFKNGEPDAGSWYNSKGNKYQD